MSLFSKYKKIFILIVTTIILIMLINYSSVPREQMTFPQQIVGYVVMPFQKTFNFIFLQIGDAFSFFDNIGSLNEENKILNDKIQSLEYQLRDAQNLKAENQQLREMLELKQDYDDYDLVSAQVIGRSAENWNNTILINKGLKHGLAVNLQVISPSKGLIGRIIDLGNDWSKIMLITDSDSSVSGMIERSRDIAVVRGDPVAIKKGYLKLSYILPDSDIKTNDIIITSGYGEIYSKGITIGKVVEVKDEPNDLTKYAYIEPVADFRRLEEVLVINKINQ